MTIKNTISLFGALAILLPVGMQASTFPDVATEHPNAQAVEWGVENELVNGYPDGTFKPGQPVKRAEFMKILAEYYRTFHQDKVYLDLTKDEIEICGKEDPAEDLRIFSDIEFDAWYIPYLCHVTIALNIGGYPDGTFRPENHINFAEISKLAHNGTLGGFSIKTLEGPWYRTHVVYLEEHAAIPHSITSFDQEVTRGEILEILWRLQAQPELPSMTYEQIGEETWVSDSDPCTDLPTRRGNDTEEFPIAEEYENLGILGQVFTAYDCGPERLRETFGDEETVVGKMLYVSFSSDDGITEGEQFVLSELRHLKPICHAGTCSFPEADGYQLNVGDMLSLHPYADDIVNTMCVGCY